MVRAALLQVRAASLRPVVACGPAELWAHRWEQAARHSAWQVAQRRGASAERLPQVELAEVMAVSVPDGSGVRLPRVESPAAEEFESDVSVARRQVVARPQAAVQVAVVVQVESDARAQSAAPDAAEVRLPVVAAAWDARAVPPRAVVAARHGEVAQEVAVLPDAVVRRQAAEEPAVLDAAEVLRPEVAQHAVARPAAARPAVPAVVQAVAPQVDPSAAASVCRQDRSRLAAARRPAARSVHEMWHLQTASQREQSSQAAQGEVWS